MKQEPNSAPARPSRKPQILGWVAVAMNLLVGCTWAFWGTAEAFHEGWFHASLLANVRALLVYTSPAWASIMMGVAMIRWPRAGSAVYGVVWLAAGVFFGQILLRGRPSPLSVLFDLGFCGFGGLAALFGWMGRPRPMRAAIWLTVALPILISVAMAVEPISRLVTRVDDGYRGARLLQGNGVDLIWAPAGPGWPGRGTDWPTAKRICRYLSPDGTKLCATPQSVWRLPTVDETVRSMTRGGANAGGKWDGRTATYRRGPDKESPLWIPTSEVIYYWTSDEIAPSHAYVMVYHGGVFSKPKSWRGGTQGFRAVRSNIAASSSRG